MKKIGIYKFADGKMVYKEIEDAIENLQAEVDGWIEALPIGESTMLICDEEGKLKDKKPTAFVMFNGITDIIVGDFFIVGVKGDDFVTATAKDIMACREHVKAISFI